MNSDIDIYDDVDYDPRDIPPKLLGVRYATVLRIGDRAVVDVRHEAYDCADFSKYCGEPGATYRQHRLFYSAVVLSDGHVSKIDTVTLHEHEFDQSVLIMSGDRHCHYEYPNMNEAIRAITDLILKQVTENVSATCVLDLPQGCRPTGFSQKPPQHRLRWSDKTVAAFAVGAEG